MMLPKSDNVMFIPALTEQLWWMDEGATAAESGVEIWFVGFVML